MALPIVILIPNEKTVVAITLKTPQAKNANANRRRISKVEKKKAEIGITANVTGIQEANV